MAEYTEKQTKQRRQAVAKYTKTVDRVNCLLPSGTKERIKKVSGKSINAFIKEAVLIQLEQLERLK
ncbi:MAG: ParG [Bacteriophage sp.]|nr:MAG: ParG [Bacteriophage sp.]